jgi:multiple sugar transport system ATP-binding protein
MAEVVLRQLTKKYGRLVAVDGIDLRIEDRELVVLVGPSGCGKTTTLRMIAGLEDITAGEIHIGGRLVNRVSPKDRDIAMVFQNYALYPHMNVYKNMAFGLKMRRVGKAEIEQRVKQAAGILGIEDLLQRKPAELSGGQRQRVAVGRAIVRDPRVFLFDEPLSNLDAKLRVTMRTELVKLQQQLETTMIHVTHDQVEAMMMGQRIVVMNEGRLQQVGRPSDVYNAPVNRFVAGFIGSPPMNFLNVRIRMSEDGPVAETSSFALMLPPQRRESLQAWADRQVTLGVRPEDITTAALAANGSQRLRARVVVAQPIGAETILDLQCGEHELAARADARQDHRPGDLIDVHVNTARCHLFDPAGGKAI